MDLCGRGLKRSLASPNVDSHAAETGNGIRPHLATARPEVLVCETGRPAVVAAP